MRSRPCPYCGAELAIVHVHGHGQCARCGTNLEPCCGGADALDEAGEGGSSWQLGPDLLQRVFEQLGSVGRSVTADSLRLALARALDASLQHADDVLELAVRLGRLVRTGAVYRLPDDTDAEVVPPAPLPPTDG